MKSSTKFKAAQVVLLVAATSSFLVACGGGSSPQPQNQPQQNAASSVPVALPIAQPISSPVAAPVIAKPILKPVTPPPAVVVQTATSIDFTPTQIAGASDMLVNANSFMQNGLPVGILRYSNLTANNVWVMPTNLQSIPLCNTPAAAQSPTNPLATCTTVLTSTFSFTERDAAGLTLAAGSITF